MRNSSFHGNQPERQSKDSQFSSVTLHLTYLRWNQVKILKDSKIANFHSINSIEGEIQVSMATNQFANLKTVNSVLFHFI